jgi:hypothetical protein
MRSLIALVFVTTTTRAFADDAPPEPPSYLMQTLAADGITLGLGFGSYKTESSTSTRLGEAALGVLVLGAPTVHLLHKRWGRGAASLAVRIGLPLVGIALGGAWGAPCLPARDCDEYDLNQLKGMAVGAIAAMVFDATLLGHDVASTPAIAPTVTAANGGLSFGLGGRF